MKDSRISWTDHTHNPWIGCTKVSPGCDHCYAEAQAWRHGVEWGPHGQRRRVAPSTLGQPLTWNRQAEKDRRPAFVFCASLADVFDNQADPAWRGELFGTIRATPWLVWLLLTKRPQNVRRMLPPDWGEGWPNVWLGTTAESRAEAKRRLPILLEVPARVRFVSAEPLLEGISLADWLGPDRVGWVICGAESGKRARPFDPDWARRLRDECTAAGVSFFYKQEIGSDGRKVETPLLDGRRWTERPAPELLAGADLPLLLGPASVATDGLAERLDAAHQAVVEAFRDAVARGLEFGEMLVTAKAVIGHGGWEGWIKANCAFSARTARAYMRLARELPKLDPAKRQRVADLSLRDALAALATDARNVRALPETGSGKVLEEAPEAGLRQPLKRAVNEQRYAATHAEPVKQAAPAVCAPRPPLPPPPAPDPDLGWAVLELLGRHAAAKPGLTLAVVHETLNVVYFEILERGLAGAKAAFLHEYGDELRVGPKSAERPKPRRGAAGAGTVADAAAGDTVLRAGEQPSAETLLEAEKALAAIEQKAGRVERQLEQARREGDLASVADRETVLVAIRQVAARSRRRVERLRELPDDARNADRSVAV